MNDATRSAVVQDKNIMFDNSTVSAIHKCSSKEAKSLWIHDLGSYKLKKKGIYDIGGTYTDAEPDLWFFFTVEICPGQTALLNLFVCQRRVGSCSIGVSDSSKLREPDCTHSYYAFSNSLKTNVYKSFKPNENHYITTYFFSLKEIRKLEKYSLLIPLHIEMNLKTPLEENIIKKIQLEHSFKGIFDKHDTTDFTLISASGRQFRAHKIVLAVHSQVLLNIIRNAQEPSASLDISDGDMELLLHFIYTGAIDFSQDSSKLLEIATKFEIASLLYETQYVLCEQININNAIDIASLSIKYNLRELQAKVFQYIKSHLEVLETRQWKNLTDVELAKQLVHFISQP